MVRPADETAEASGDDATFSRRLPVPWSGKIELPSVPGLVLSVELDGYWTPERVIHQDVPGTRFGLVPLGAIEGTQRRRTDRGHEGSMRAVVQPGSELARTLGVPPDNHFTFECSQSGPNWRCPVPAGDLDLKLEGEGGFAPHYFWNVQIEPRETSSLGSLIWIEGASISGWIADAGLDDPPRDVIVRATAAGVSPEDPRGGLRASEAKTDERGFFQLLGLAPGAYSLAVSTPSGRQARFEPAHVAPGRETVLDEPIWLLEGQALSLALVPTTDDLGLPWQVHLVRLEEGSIVAHSLGEQSAGYDGLTHYEDLFSDERYLLEVRDSRGSVWETLEIDLDSIPEPLVIELGLVPITGIVSIDGEPLAAEVVFGTTSRQPNVRLRTDEEGRFQGHLPRDGTWPIDIVISRSGSQVRLEPVTVQRNADGSAAEVEIEVPNTRIRGRVIDARGQPTGAMILLLQPDTEGARKRGNLRTDENGTFEVIGLAPGTVSLAARRGERVSAWKQIEIESEVEPPEIVLSLAEGSDFEGTVRSSYGVVGGAVILATTHAVPGAVRWPREATSDIDGSFAMRLDASARTVDMLVIPPGFAMRLVQLTMPLGERTDLFVPRSGGTVVLGHSDLLTAIAHFDGASMPLKTVRSSLMRLGRLRAHEQGLALTGLAPGHWRFCSPSEMSPSTCAEAHVVAGGETLVRQPFGGTTP